MKGKIHAYVPWPLAKRVQNWIVDRSTAHDFMVVNLIAILGIGYNFLFCVVGNNNNPNFINDQSKQVITKDFRAKIRGLYLNEVSNQKQVIIIGVSIVTRMKVN